MAERTTTVLVLYVVDFIRRLVTATVIIAAPHPPTALMIKDIARNQFLSDTSGKFLQNLNQR